MFQTAHQPSSERKASQTGPRPNPPVQLGNQAMLRRLQAKLAVSQPGDPDELEADQVADQVMRMTDPMISRKCAECEEQDAHKPQTKAHVVQQSAAAQKLVQRSADDKTPVVEIPPVPPAPEPLTSKPKSANCYMSFMSLACSDLVRAEPKRVRNLEIFENLPEDYYVFGCSDNEACRPGKNGPWIIADNRFGLACGDKVTVCAEGRQTEAEVKGLKGKPNHWVSKEVATALGQVMHRPFRGIVAKDLPELIKFDCCFPASQGPGDFPEPSPDQRPA